MTAKRMAPRRARGEFALIVPEGAVAATVSDAGGASSTIREAELTDGASLLVVLVKPQNGR